MNALRIRKRLEQPIPGLPELTPLVGKTVEIIVLEEADHSEHLPAANAGPITSMDQLRSKNVGNTMDSFEEAVESWRQEPWRGADES